MTRATPVSTIETALGRHGHLVSVGINGLMRRFDGRGRFQRRAEMDGLPAGNAARYRVGVIGDRSRQVCVLIEPIVTPRFAHAAAGMPEPITNLLVNGMESMAWAGFASSLSNIGAPAHGDHGGACGEAAYSHAEAICGLRSGD